MFLIKTISVVAEEPRTFARNIVPEPMMLQQSNITTVTAVVDNLPGVSIQEGDGYGRASARATKLPDLELPADPAACIASWAQVDRLRIEPEPSDYTLNQAA